MTRSGWECITIIRDLREEHSQRLGISNEPIKEPGKENSSSTLLASVKCHDLKSIYWNPSSPPVGLFLLFPCKSLSPTGIRKLRGGSEDMLGKKGSCRILSLTANFPSPAAEHKREISLVSKSSSKIYYHTGLGT